MILMFSPVLKSDSHSLSRGGPFRDPRENGRDKKVKKPRTLKVKTSPPRPPATYVSKRFCLGPCTETDVREARWFMRVTYQPWPEGSTPESVAASIRRLRVAGILPERSAR